MILKDGFFHADPHPGNILICKDTEARDLFKLFLLLLQANGNFQLNVILAFSGGFT
jgi:predicted unusual protein kinase regulating ubiquinone biosynthesis (AarF/ABC1/UbiB family)